MRDFDWSKSEKKAATAAFNLALTRELKAIRREAEAGGIQIGLGLPSRAPPVAAAPCTQPQVTPLAARSV